MKTRNLVLTAAMLAVSAAPAIAVAKDKPAHAAKQPKTHAPHEKAAKVKKADPK